MSRHVSLFLQLYQIQVIKSWYQASVRTNMWNSAALQSDTIANEV